MEEATLREEQQLEDIAAAMKGEEISSEGFDYTNLVNAPELKVGMIPITYDETKSTWVVADKSNTDKSWYDYDNKKWANICTVDSTHSSYRNATVGTEIPVTDMTTMFVWIPRYAYSIVEGYRDSNCVSPKIEVKFLVGNTNRDKDNSEEYKTDYTPTEDMTITPWIVHPGFTFGNNQLTGFWMAKFEASGTKIVDGEEVKVGNHTVSTVGETSTATLIDAETTTPVEVLPNVISWRNLTIGESEYRCIQMSDNTTVYGWSNANTHLIKNSEWGAVAYLCYSKYGVVPSKNGAGRSGAGVWYDLYTGAGPKNGTTNDEGTYSYLDNETTQAYNKTKGKLASTTGNVYGVYDMSGGAWERVAAYLDNGNNNLNKYGKSSSNSSTKYFENGVLKTEYINLWDEYEVGTEEKSDSIEIEGEKNLTQNELRDKYSTDFISTYENPSLKYNIARKRITDANFEWLAKIKGIGVNEITSSHSYYGVQKSDGQYTWMRDESDTSGNAGFGWNNDYVNMGHGFWPFIGRGGNVSYGAYAGVLYSGTTAGYTSNSSGFRPTICP